CHNFQYLVDPSLSPDQLPNEWLRLDFKQEPIAALLHLCDEMQQWEREREDERVVYLLGIGHNPFKKTELMSFTVSDAGGIQITAQLHRTAQRTTNLPRLRFDHDREIAATS